VVLSACDTGLGRLVDGEGVVGLTRAFLHAGSRSVLVSLWPIADDPTAVLMERFYRELLRGSPRDVALQRAAASLVGDPAFAPPRFWAAFQLHGRPD
jgi:CHAT domain-containing protein